MLLVLSLTGIVIYYPQVSNLIKGLDAPDLAEPRATPPPGDPRPLSLDDLAAVAQAAVPGSTTGAVTLPRTGSAVIRFGQRFPRDGRQWPGEAPCGSICTRGSTCGSTTRASRSPPHWDPACC